MCFTLRKFFMILKEIRYPVVNAREVRMLLAPRAMRNRRRRLLGCAVNRLDSAGDALV